MELIDIVDDNGRLTGEVIEKDEAHQKNLLHNEISVLLVNSKNEILLQKRSMNKKYGAGKWGFCSGHVDHNESLIEAAIRELKEEVSVSLNNDDLVLFTDKEYRIKKSNSYIKTYYYAIVDKEIDEFIVQKEELDEVRWFTIEEVLEQINSSNNITTIDKDRIWVIKDLEKVLFGNKREIVVEMASSINGIIATIDGNEDFLLYRGWEIMLEFLKEYDCLVWGRKTFESVLSWGEEYVNDLKAINIIVMSNNYVNDTELKNVYVCKSVDDCLTLCEKMNFNKIFISGGARTNNEFLVKGVVDKLIVNYNPYVINKGIGLYDGEFFESELQLIKVIKEQDGILQVHYRVVK